ncbi:MAG: BrnA antitoxin family protein [Thermodesulfobacteriota bacterium]
MRKEYDFSKAKLVIPPHDPKKTRITIRLDTKILNWFRRRVNEAGGGNYQTMINEVLKRYIESENKKTIRHPRGPHVESGVIYQMEGEAEGSELKGRGYDLKENIRDWEAPGNKRPGGSQEKKKSTATKTVKYSRQGIEKLPEDRPVFYRIINESGSMNYVGVAQKGYVRERLSGHLGKIPGVKVQIEQFANLEDAMKKEINVIRRAKGRYGREGK